MNGTCCMKVMVSALERSANLHLRDVLKHMDQYELLGIFDPESSHETPLYRSSEFGILGIVDALKIYRKAKRAVQEMAALALHSGVETVLLIDSPAFNIPLAETLRKEGFKGRIIYYILPQVWAWKKGRIKRVEAVCDRLAAILPFEAEYWNKAEYVGNPLMDQITDFKEIYRDEDRRFLFMPGSRRSEIRVLMPVFEEVAAVLEGEKWIVIPPHFNRDEIRDLYGNLEGFTIMHNTHDAMRESDFGFICSGTATLEASVIGLPMVLAYKAKKFDYFIGKLMIKLPYVGLANLIRWFAKEDQMHTELLQEEVNSKRLLEIYHTMDRTKFRADAVQLRDRLKLKGASLRVAEMLKEGA